MDGDEPTQATQNVLDPRRVGKQNSGFSDEDISDIICVLYPHSDSARLEVQRLAQEDCPHVIGKDEVGGVEPDYELEDHASRFESDLGEHGNYAIILRLSATIKNPAAGFTFGRNNARCDVVFLNDPVKRISNVHFRILVNEFGTVMLEDQSTNGTFVDRKLLTTIPKQVNTQPVTRWALSSGSNIKVLLHQQAQDLTFRVRIPRREDDYATTYLTKVEEYYARHAIRARPPNPGPVDVFKQPGEPLGPRRPDLDTNGVTTQPMNSPSRRKERHNTLRREWNGSGKYNRIGTIGKGAFAVVYKVTSKYDGRPYAAKELEKRRFIKNGVLDQKVDNEMKIMQRVQHPNIVRYIENFDWDDRLLIIIMEFVQGGDLGKLISEEGPLSEDMVQTMSKQLLGALGYLHSKNITHRDVKPDNILIHSLEPLEVKLTDFGLSKVVDSEQTFLRTFCGTLLYCAPEVYTEYTEYDDRGHRSRGQKVRRVPGQRYNHAVDIWSLGGVLFFTLTGAPPYPVKSGISYSELLHKIMTSRLDITPLQSQGVSERGVDFLSRMLQKRPENRATIIELDTHPWIGEPGSIIDASQSYDEVTDDEDMIKQLQQPVWDEDDRVSDSMGEESEKENLGTFGLDHEAERPRLFGEIGVSAVGSSGVLPDDFVALPMNNGGSRETAILHYPDDEADDSAASSEYASSRQDGQGAHHAALSVFPNQSADQLQSLVEEVASQSLGGRDSRSKEVSVSRNQSIDFNASKRKPPSTNTSDEFEDNTAGAKPTFKRLKSEGNLDDASEDYTDECKLLACVPQIRILGSGRQIDTPVDKIAFWEQDRATWHLVYPEMTQLQADAFTQATRDRGEDFWPGKSRLWDLAMTYFPPTHEARAGQHLDRGRVGLRRDDRKMAEDPIEFPPTAMPVDDEDIPDTLPPSGHGIVVPVREDASNARAVGILESQSASQIKISLMITDQFLSFGRGPDNTEVFEPRTESMVPKYAFKIVAMRDGQDLARDTNKAPPPWQMDDDPDAYHFWISTKATLGIRINGQTLASYEPKRPTAASLYWTPLFDGDELMIWGDPKKHTSLTFRCFWGASSKPRADVDRPLEFAAEDFAHKLDVVSQRAEKRHRDASEKRRRVSEAAADFAERIRLVDLERERSRVFEVKRQEAVRFLQSKQIPIPRRGSTASAPPTAYPSRLHTTTTLSRLTPDYNTDPAL